MEPFLLQEKRHVLVSTFIHRPALGQRAADVAVARGLMSQPVVLLLDEPSPGLAPKVIEELPAALDALRQESMTVLLVDQMAALALSLADRAYVLESGRVVAQGTAPVVAGRWLAGQGLPGWCGLDLVVKGFIAGRPAPARAPARYVPSGSVWPPARCVHRRRRRPGPPSRPGCRRAAPASRRRSWPRA